MEGKKKSRKLPVKKIFSSSDSIISLRVKTSSRYQEPENCKSEKHSSSPAAETTSSLLRVSTDDVCSTSSKSSVQSSLNTDPSSPTSSDSLSSSRMSPDPDSGAISLKPKLRKGNKCRTAHSSKRFSFRMKKKSGKIPSSSAQAKIPAETDHPTESNRRALASGRNTKRDQRLVLLTEKLLWCVCVCMDICVGLCVAMGVAMCACFCFLAV